jgi:hypothetical protein
MMKMHPAAPPQVIGGIDIFGDKANLCGPADKLVVLRAALGSNQRQNRTAIRGRDRYPTVKFETAIGNYAESKPVYIELQASVMIAYEDVGLENP